MESHKFSIVADDGINAVVPIDFWENLKNLLTEKFKKDEFAAGLTQILDLTGEQLKRNFPHDGGSDSN
jgi:uncharacterized membrane protein